MGGGRGAKRNHTRFAQDNFSDPNIMGIGATLAHLRASSSGETTVRHTDGDNEPSDSGEWQTISRNSKRQKQTNYPTLTYSNSYRMQTSIKLGDLQSLVLYCLADGTSPQWVALRHHKMIDKAVVLFVPGLEKGMFDGSIALLGSEPANPKVSSQSLDGDADALQDVGNGAKDHESPSNLPSQSSFVLDEFLPTFLEAEKLPTLMRPLAETFPHIWPVKAPGDERLAKVHSPLQAMLQSPISKTQEEKRADKDKKGPKPAREGKHWENKRTRITEYLLSAAEQQENEYVLHPASLDTPQERENNALVRAKHGQAQQDGWVDTHVEDLSRGAVPETQIQKGSLSAGRNVLAMDCEMCKVEGDEFALTRISLVNWDGDTILDELVKPEKPITDYVTAYSGITPEALAPVNTTLSDIQDRLISILTPKSVLIGHSLNADLTALKLTHPFVIDTALLYPHPRGPPLKSSLKWLAQRYLSREIQKGHGINGHDSIEDAKTCLDLVKLKCERGPAWGTNEAAHESIFKRLKRSSPSPFSPPGVEGKEGAIIDHGIPGTNHSFRQMASYSITCSSDSEIVDATKRAVLGDPAGEYIPSGGVAFTWVRLRELEIVRGWRQEDTLTSSSSTTEPPPPPPASSTAESTPSPLLETTIANTIKHINQIRAFLPKRTLFIVYSGTGDPREMARWQEMQRQHRREYKVKKWDQLSIKWTDVEEQALRQAVKTAREGLGFVCVT